MESVIETLSAGQITVGTGLVAVIVALIGGAVGGAVGGIIVGGKHLGNELAAMMGSFYGPIAAVPGVILALAIFLVL